MLGTRMWLHWGVYNWIYFFLLFHSLSLERKLHLSLIQQSGNSYVPWMNELKQYAISYFNWLLWKSWPATLDWHLVFYNLKWFAEWGSPQQCDAGSAGTVCKRLLGQFLSHVHQFHTAVAAVATFSWLSLASSKKQCRLVSLDVHLKTKISFKSKGCAQAVTLFLKHHCCFFSHFCAEFVHPGPGCSRWDHSKSTQTSTEVLCQGCGGCADSELMAAHPLLTPCAKGYCHHCSFTESNCFPSRLAGSSQLHGKGGSLSLPTPLMCLCAIATKCLQNLAR